MVALGVEEDLGLVLEPPEGLGVDDAVAVALVDRPKLVGLLLNFPPFRIKRSRRGRGEGRFSLFPYLAGTAEKAIRRSGPLF